MILIDKSLLRLIIKTMHTAINLLDHSGSDFSVLHIQMSVQKIATKT